MDQNLSMTRGDTGSFNLQFVNYDGDLENDMQSMIFTVKENVDSGVAVFQKTLGSGISKVNDSLYVVRIAPTDTEDLGLGYYYYDLQIRINGDAFTVLKGVIEITYDVTTTEQTVIIAPYEELEDIRVGYDGKLYDTAGEAVRGQISDLHNEVDVLDGRMDEFASLPEGSTVGDAELADIRVGADGTTYPTAGDAVRGQVEELDNKIDNNTDAIGDIDSDVDVLKSRMDVFTSLEEGSTTADAELEDIRVAYNSKVYPTAGEAVRGQVSEIHDDFDDILKDVYSKNRYNGHYSAGYVNQVTGAWSEGSTTYAGTDEYISLPDSPFVIGVHNLASTTSLGFRYAVYDENKDYISGAVVDISNFTFIPDPNDPAVMMGYYEINVPTAKYFRFSMLAGILAIRKIQVEIGSLPTKYYPYTGDLKIINPSMLSQAKGVDQLFSSVIGAGCMKNHADSLSDGESLEINVDNSIRKNKLYHLHTLIDSGFDKLYFGHGQGSYSLYFKLDDTNITFMSNGSAGSALPHGLTLDTYIDIMLKVSDTNQGTLIINTLGGVYSRAVQIVNGYKGNVFVEPDGCNITDVTIDFTCTDFRQPIWLFGDSYFTHTSTDRWAYYLIDWGFGRCLLNAFPGENSTEAFDQISAYIPKYGIPSFAVWCLGMNDPDSSSAINSTWKTKVEAFISLCNTYGITPILATIPNVPSYSHYYKNNYVTESGYRYIDFAKAVGAKSVGSSWYAGCLSNDNTHPTSLGARLLCLQALQDLPELTLGNI